MSYTTPGTKTVTVTGGTSATCTVNVNQPPVVNCSITSPTPPYNTFAPITFSSAGTSDPEGNIPLAYAWAFPGGSITTSTAASPPAVTWNAVGTYAVTLTVTDSLGGASAPMACGITIGTAVNQPPVANPKTYDVAAGITFQTTANYQGSLASVASDPDPGTTLGFTTCPPLLPGLSLDPTGHFAWPSPPTPQVLTFQYKVSDGASQSPCATVTLNVVPNQKPVAKFSASPNPVKVGDIVSFADLSTDPDPSDLIVQWSWSFGDGQLSSQSNPGHVFGTVGSPAACLTVMDGNGATSVTQCQTINVEAEAQAPPPGPPESAPVEQPGGGGSVDEPEDEPALTVRIDGPASALPGETVTLTAHVDGGPASLTWFKLHGDATMTPSGNSVSFTVPQGADSLYVGVTASSQSASAQAAHLVSVRSPAETNNGKVPGGTDPDDLLPDDVPSKATTGFTMRTDGNTVEVIPHVTASKYVWNFGDGTPEQESVGTLQHTYEDSGTYEITMTAGAKDYVASAEVAAPDASVPETDAAQGSGSGVPLPAIAALGAVLLVAGCVLAILLARRRRAA